jgi:hypothetical protein
MKESDQLATSFITPFGMYCYVTMSFGLRNASATYQLLTPKFGKESDLWVQLGEKSVRRKEGFFRCIRQKNPRSAICFHSARELLS